MRRAFNRPFTARQAPAVTGRKPAPWPRWIQREAVSILAAKAKEEADHDAESERSERPRRWERRI
jgi:hypothetical protein